MDAILNPLSSATPPEIPLPNAPLVRVIAQVRFPSVLAVEQAGRVAPFQEALRRRYPIASESVEQVRVLGASSPAPEPAKSIWRFADDSETWHVSLSRDFVALETERYASRSDFLARLAEVLEALGDLRPARVGRIGMRYIDRIQGQELRDIADLVRSEIAGVAATAAAGACRHAVTQCQFEVEEAVLLARWGKLPAGATMQASGVDPIDEESWTLDLDMFSSHPSAFDIDLIRATAQRFAERIYTFFRWAIKPEFLRRYGGTA